MRTKIPFLLLPLLLIGCQPSDKKTVLKTEYRHAYGVTVNEDDWKKMGQTGSQILYQNDGVKISRAYSKGALHGDTTYTYSHSHILQKKVSYASGILKRELFYDHNGIPLREVVYQENHREENYWYLTGMIRHQEIYQGDLLIKGSYYSPKEELESQVEHKEGSRTLRDPYGLLVSQEEIFNGIKSAATLYYPNGMPSAYYHYSNGQLDGKQTFFHPEGSPRMTELWCKGIKSGITIEFENGHRSAEIPYIQSQKHGVEKHYQNDQLVMEITWLKGQRHGPVHHHLPDETLSQWYHHDREVSQATFYSLEQRENNFADNIG